MKDAATPTPEPAESVSSAKALPSVCEASPSACCIVADGDVVHANAAAAGLLGMKAPDDLSGTRLSRYVALDRRRVFSALLARAAAGGAVRPFEAQWQRPDGSTFQAECTFAPTRWDHGDATQVLIHDVSDRQATIDSLRESSHRKDAFLAAIAHELRNPLAPLRAGLDVALRCPESDPRLADALSIMDRQLNHLSTLVDDLVDVSQAGSGQLSLVRKPVELSDVLDECAAATRSALQTRRHVLDLWVAPPAGHVVLGDYDRLVQVFTNLLLNAAKYTPPGGVIRGDLQHAGGSEVVTITDNGSGIAPADLPRLFHPFERFGKEGTDRPEGMGIGLTVAQQLVNLHNGRIEAESEGLGRGSVFRVTLPRWEGADAGETIEPAARREPLSAASIPPRRVLIADDDHDVAESLRLLLETLGHKAWTAHDGREAIAQALALRPDLLLLDLSMPDIGGLEVARRLRATLGGDDIHIAALTGHCQPIDRERTRAAGFDWHFVKPVTSEALLTVLSQLPEKRTPPA